jgi:peptide deformylase
MEKAVADLLPPKLMPVRKYGDPVLRAKARAVTDFGEELQKLVKDMFHTMYTEPGIGLAAPQVGVPRRLVVIDVSPGGGHTPMVLINPKIDKAEGRIDSEEGCLSFPGIHILIPRAQNIEVSALNEKGLPITIKADGMLSRCIQHEMDHLDGVLMVDHLPWPRRLKVFWDIRRRKKSGLW